MQGIVLVPSPLQEVAAYEEKPPAVQPTAGLDAVPKEVSDALYRECGFVCFSGRIV